VPQKGCGGLHGSVAAANLAINFDSKTLCLNESWRSTTV
jgi:hypothetical protein